MKQSVSTEFSGVNYSLETGELAKFAHGSVTVRFGDTMVLVAVTASKEPKDLDFIPLSVEYREKQAAAGKIPGGFFRREGKPSDKEVLSARLIDRPIRPLFPKDWRCETQVVATVFSYDLEHDSDTLAMVATSAALMMSNIPFNGPVSEVTVGRINGEFVCNPTLSQLKESDVEMCVAGTDDSIMMVEGESKEISEDDFLLALEFAHENIRTLNNLQRELVKNIQQEKRSSVKVEQPQELVDLVESTVGQKVKDQIRNGSSKEERGGFRSLMTAEAIEAVNSAFPLESDADTLKRQKVVDKLVSKIEQREMREMILEEGTRLDGRKTVDVRPITITAGYLPRTHGSALFTRGETQSLTTVTLGTKTDEQIVDGLLPTWYRRYMLHYNFPPFSTGETGRMFGTSRREVGHGNLAERALKPMMPDEIEFPYTIRIVSDILESNGSSSMATVCAGSIAMFDAGAPLKKAVSGIAMGLIKEGDRVAILSDILGDEDFLGDMDFKVCGTDAGITACQMDIKIGGISLDIMRKALLQARDGRLHILAEMNKALDAPREDLSQYAPRLTTIMIPQEFIGAVIGSGGETIRTITKETNTEINIEDDGKIVIAATSQEAAQAAIDWIMSLTRKPEEGMVYTATVKEVRDGLGAIVEFLPKTKGLLHVSQMDWKRVEDPHELFKAGDKVDVKLIEIQSDGKFRLSRKALIPPPEGMEYRDDERRGGGDRGGRRDDRGGRGGFDRGRRDDRGGRDDRRRDDRPRDGGGDDRRRDDKPRDGGGDDRRRDDRPRDGGGDDRQREERPRDGGGDDRQREERPREGGGDDRRRDDYRGSDDRGSEDRRRGEDRRGEPQV